MLFLLVMDPLLRQLQELSLGTSVDSFYTGGFLHADDNCNLASSISTLEEQVALVQTFASGNFLKLIVAKYEVIVFSTDMSETTVECSIDGDAGKCLGYWWRRDLMSTRAFQENIKKARRSFFMLGSIGVFQGDLSPLFSRSVVEVYVGNASLDVRSENWILNETTTGRTAGILPS